MGDRPDPDDLAGLESSLNDSATRVSTVWISYLLFGLYLLVAAGTATHRQLLLEEPLKLPALGSDVPLVWFFLISPALFVLLHFYMLLQVLLLGRTAQAYNRALNQTLRIRSENNRYRQRLANTLFAQYFAGAPRERLGWVGNIIKSIAWITLIGGPIYLIFTFQLAFLPYHSPLVTWTHRSMLCIEVAIALIIGSVAVAPQRDLSWASILNRISRAWQFPSKFLAASADERTTLRPRLLYYLRQSSYALLILISIFLITFPGEWHINILALDAPGTVRCDRLLPLANRFDRLSLTNANVADSEKLAKWNEDVPRGQPMYEGPRSKNLSGRDLNCSTLNSADLRRASLNRTLLFGSSLQNARLEGASMQFAVLDNAILSSAYITDANLFGAFLRRSTLDRAVLDRSELSNAHLQGADFSLGSLLGVDLRYVATMQGTNFIEADMRGAKLTGAHLEGASLQRAKLDGANLAGAFLFAADLENAQLQAADLSAFQGDPLKDKADFSMARMLKTWLSLTDMGGAILDGALVDHAFLWGVTNIDCSKAYVLAPDLSEQIKPVPDYDPREAQPPTGTGVKATPQALSRIVYDLEYMISKSTLDRIRDRITQAQNGPAGQTCPDNSSSSPFDDITYANRIADQICNPATTAIRANRSDIAAGIIRNALDPNPRSERKSSAYIATIASRFLGCMRNELSENDRIALTTKQKVPAPAKTP